VHEVDAVVVGAGAVGLACGAALARSGHEVLVLDAAPWIGAGTTSRNSEVVHAGLYYPADSLKRRLCVEGRRSLYAYLQDRGVAHKRCGKFIVAADPTETPAIEALHARGRANEVEGLSLLTADQARRAEPHLRCAAALSSEQTGVLDVHGFISALEAEISDHGGQVVLNARVSRVDRLPDGRLCVRLEDDAEFRLASRFVVNAAGLHAQSLARNVDGIEAVHIPPLVLAKGSYFTCGGRSPFSRLIYPAPVAGGLGVHLTLDLAGQMRFGPDVEWLDHDDPDRVDYRVDPARSAGFHDAVRRYWPDLPEGALQPGYSGCRPKVEGGDFRIDGPETHGLPGLVNLFGIESPGLTSSLAIARLVTERLA
jgi:L-2-hydroxyglutarate oxidase LhgO